MLKFQGIARLAALLPCAALFCVHANANLLTNGSFENGTFVNDGNQTMTLLPPSTTITGWTVVGREVAWIRGGNAWGLTAQEGDRFLDLAGYLIGAPFGGVEQTITTVPGTLYALFLSRQLHGAVGRAACLHQRIGGRNHTDLCGTDPQCRFDLGAIHDDVHSRIHKHHCESDRCGWG